MVVFSNEDWITFALLCILLQLQKEIVDTLLSFTQPDFISHGEEGNMPEKTVLNSQPFYRLYSVQCACLMSSVICKVMIVHFFLLALSNSLWTMMMKELMRYSLKSPYVYMSGLLLLSELVPLPIPILTKEVQQNLIL